MSGIIGSKINIRGSGKIAKLGTDGQVLTSAGAGLSAAFEDLAAGISWQAIETGSTMTAVAGEGYWVDTTSNTCTITLPASATNGDTIIFADYARTWGTYKVIIDSNGLKYQGDPDTFVTEYDTDGQAVKIVYSDATNGWIPILDQDVTYVPDAPGNQNGLFGFGYGGFSQTNIVSNAGVVGTDVTGVGTGRSCAATEYGGDKAIFGYGNAFPGTTYVSMTNLVSNTGVVATDVGGVGTARSALAACEYGEDKGIFGFGYASGVGAVGMSNLVSNVGVVASDVAAVGTVRDSPAACEYGGDKGIFGFGHNAPGGSPTYLSMTSLVSNLGVISADVAGVGSVKKNLGGCSYGGDKGIFAYGYSDAGGSPTYVSWSNLISNVGVCATDVTGVGSARNELGACEYGSDKGIFGYGSTGSVTAVTNLVSTIGVVGTDVTGVGTARRGVAGCSYA